MTTVRNDVFKIGDNFATLFGDEVKVGQAAPEFTSVISGWTTGKSLAGIQRQGDHSNCSAFTGYRCV